MAGAGIAHSGHIAHVLFGPPYLPEYGLKGGIVQLQFHLLVDFAQYCLLLTRVDDLKLFVQEQLLRILPQQPVAEAVVGADKAHVIVLTDEPPDPLLHLPGRFVGKGNAQYIGRIDAIILHQVGIAAHQQLRLAAARPGNHPHIAFRLQYRLALSFIEIVHEIRHTHPCRFFCELILSFYHEQSNAHGRWPFGRCMP